MTPSKRPGPGTSPGLTKALAHRREVANKWAVLSGTSRYDDALAFAEQEKASQRVREEALTAGATDVDTRLHSEVFPSYMASYVAGMRAQAVKRGLL